ncbi:MAG: hypothetical protein WC184_00130 [Acidimicrobiia bacterium]
MPNPPSRDEPVSGHPKWLAIWLMVAVVAFLFLISALSVWG